MLLFGIYEMIFEAYFLEFRQARFADKVLEYLKFDLMDLQLSKVDPKFIWILNFGYCSIISHDFLFSWHIFSWSKIKPRIVGYEQIFGKFYFLSYCNKPLSWEKDGF